MNHKRNIFGDKSFYLASLFLVAATLKQLHKGQRRKRTPFMRHGFNEPARLLVTAQVPNQNIGIKDYLL